MLGKIVKGQGHQRAPNEMQVDIGTKHTGIVPLSELTHDPNAKGEIW